MFKFLKQQKKQKARIYASDAWEYPNEAPKANHAYTPLDFLQNKQKLDELYQTSWTAKKVVDIPVDDMFIFPRKIKGLTDAEDDKIIQLSKKLGIQDKINKAIKASRVYGSAYIVMMSFDGFDLEDEHSVESTSSLGACSEPLTISEHFDLQNLLVFSKFEVNISQQDIEFSEYATNFGCPNIYRFRGGSSVQELAVHHTRVIPIHYSPELTQSSRYSSVQKNAGKSIFSSIYPLINQAFELACATRYLTSEVSIPVMKVPHFQDAQLASVQADRTVDIKKTVEDFNRYKSLYKTVMIDKEMDFSRLEPSFSGFVELFDKYHAMIAAAANIPETRFMGKSPSGLNSTGDSDAQNYAMSVNFNQECILRPIYDRLDPLIFATIGLQNKVTEYEFKKLIHISDLQKSEVRKNNAQTLGLYLRDGVITEQEARQDIFDKKDMDIDPSLELPEWNVEETSGEEKDKE